MPVVSLTGKDTVTITANGESRTLADLADGNCVTITFPNSLIELKKGKENNTLYNFNYSGLMVDVELRVVIGSSDDKFLNGLIKTLKADPPSFGLIGGSFVKRTGDGEGNVANVKYLMSGGVPSKPIDSGENTEGDTTFNVAIYKLTFANSDRNLG